jgi:hypothetical protein
VWSNTSHTEFPAKSLCLAIGKLSALDSSPPNSQADDRAESQTLSKVRISVDGRMTERRIRAGHQRAFSRPRRPIRPRHAGAQRGAVGAHLERLPIRDPLSGAPRAYSARQTLARREAPQIDPEIPAERLNLPQAHSEHEVHLSQHRPGQSPCPMPSKVGTDPFGGCTRSLPRPPASGSTAALAARERERLSSAWALEVASVTALWRTFA